MTVLWGASRFGTRTKRIFSSDEKSFRVSCDMVHLRTMSALVFKVIGFLFCAFCGVIVIESTQTFNVYATECVAVVN